MEAIRYCPIIPESFRMPLTSGWIPSAVEINMLVIKGEAKDRSAGTVLKDAITFSNAYMIGMIITVLVPQMAAVSPNRMKKSPSCLFGRNTWWNRNETETILRSMAVIL